MAFKGHIIEDAIVRIDGTDELVGVATVTLPDIEHKAESITGFGVIEHEHIISTAFNAMALTLKFINRNKKIAFGTGNINLTITAAIGGVDTDTHDNDEEKIVISIKGKKKKTSGGELGKATKNETEIELALTYYKEEIDDVVIHEIDTYNRKAVVNGIDAYEKIKTILS